MKKHFPLLIFLFVYLFSVFLTFKSYGITWDEQAVYERGKMLYRHIVDPDYKLVNNLVVRKSVNDVWPTYYNSYAALLYAFNQNQSYDLYHLYNLIFVSVLFISAYFFIYKKYQNGLYAIIGPIFILLNPRFSGDVAGNPKDMPFAVMYFVSVVAIYMISYNRNILIKVLILGFLFALTQSMRIVGFSIYVILILYDFYIQRELFLIKNKFNFNNLFKFLFREIPYVVLIFIVANFFMLISWPYIASNYFKHFADVLNTAKLFPWTGNVFFLGKDYLSLDLPLTYLPILLLVSMPLFIVIFSVSSLALVKKSLLKNEVLFLTLSAVVVNMLFYFTVKPIVYNGLRHFLYLLPFFSILAAIFIIEVLKHGSSKIKKLIFVFVVANCLLVIFAVIKIFPYQYLYFNESVGGFKGGAKYFEIDYWNASFKEGITWLKENELDPNTKYNIHTCSSSHSLLNYFTYNLTWVRDIDEADYAVCHTSSDEYKKMPGKIIYTVERDTVPLNYVFKIK